MSDDARLEEWLALTESALDPADPEPIQTLERICARRAELQEALAEDPPAAPSTQLGERLRDSERELQRHLAGLRDQLHDRLHGLRGVRRGARGYRPTLGSRPAFISRSV